MPGSHWQIQLFYSVLFRITSKVSLGNCARIALCKMAIPFFCGVFVWKLLNFFVFVWCTRKPVADIFLFFSKRTNSFRLVNLSDIAFLHSLCWCCARYMSSDNLKKRTITYFKEWRRPPNHSRPLTMILVTTDHNICLWFDSFDLGVDIKMISGKQLRHW